MIISQKSDLFTSPPSSQAMTPLSPDSYRDGEGKGRGNKKPGENLPGF